MSCPPLCPRKKQTSLALRRPIGTIRPDRIGTTGPLSEPTIPVSPQAAEPEAPETEIGAGGVPGCSAIPGAWKSQSARQSSRIPGTGDRRSRTPGASVNPSRHQQTNAASMGTSSLSRDQTGLPTMLAGPCTGALWRRLPTGLPSMAQPPRHMSPVSVPGHKVAPGRSRRSAQPLRHYPRKVLLRKVQGRSHHSDPLREGHRAGYEVGTATVKPGGGSGDGPSSRSGFCSWS